MTITYYYIIGALLAYAAGVYAPSYYYTIILFWIGGSLTAVSIAYIFKRPQIFRKKQDGTIPFYIRWLFIPFLFGVQLYNTWARKNDSVPAVQKITENLFLACRLFPSDLPELEQNKVKSILDVTAEFDGLDWTASGGNLNYLNIPVLDHQSPSTEQLIHAINWIDMHIKQHGVVVHCALGRGRSVFIVAAYLLSKNRNWSIPEVLEKIHGVRKTAGLNRQQMKALRAAHESGVLNTIKRIALIANPVSGGGKWMDNRDEIVQRLSTKYALTIYETQVDKPAKILTEQAINEGHQIVVACGGDGTIAEVASVLIDNNLTLGILPLGTTNALSHVLHGLETKVFPISVGCDVILAAKVRLVDTASCNNEPVLLMASIGLSQKMIESASRKEKNIGGQFAYIKGLWNALILDQSVQLTVTIDQQPCFQLDTTSFVVANAAPFSTILAQGGGEPNMTDGLLDITWLPDNATMAEQILNLTELATNGLVESQPNSNIQFRQAKSIILKADSVLDYVIDGENRKASKISIRINPKSLKVLS